MVEQFLRISNDNHCCPRSLEDVFQSLVDKEINAGMCTIRPVTPMMASSQTHTTTNMCLLCIYSATTYNTPLTVSNTNSLY